MDAFVAAGAADEVAAKTTTKTKAITKEDAQTATVFLPKEFHKKLRVYSLTNKKQMWLLLGELLQRGAKDYKKEDPDFPDWES